MDRSITLERVVFSKSRIEEGLVGTKYEYEGLSDVYSPASVQHLSSSNDAIVDCPLRRLTMSISGKLSWRPLGDKLPILYYIIQWRESERNTRNETWEVFRRVTISTGKAEMYQRAYYGSSIVVA